MQPFEKKALLFLLKHLLSGVACALVLGTGVLLLDIAHIGTLVRASDSGVLVTFLLYFGLIITFGSVAMGVGIMSIDSTWDR